MTEEERQLLLKLIDERLRALVGRELGGNESALLVSIRNAFYSSDAYRNMTTAEKCAVQDDGFLNDYD